jgi:UDP-N-acetylmuramoylalanine--D-glutamate ligase
MAKIKKEEQPVRKRLVVLGGGVSGIGAAILGRAQGFDVFLSDANRLKPKNHEMLQIHHVRYEYGQGHSEQLILNADEVVKSPGIPDDAPIVQKVREAGIPIISEIDFAVRYNKAKLICVTGSNGKTTTASLIYDIMKGEGLKVGLAGNIGQSFAIQVAFKRMDYYVLELSSFQLDNTYHLKADVAILLNITPDHMDRYDHSLERYAKSKLRIAQNMDKKGVFIYCADDEVTKKYLPEANVQAQMLSFSQRQQLTQGAFLTSNNDKLVSMYKKDVFEMLAGELSLKGKHNLYNSMAASIAGQVLKIKKENIRNSLLSFESIEHRLEPVLKVGGVLFINDSKATNINSTWYALESMTTPTVWIVGGVDKGNDYGELMELVRQKVKASV